MGTWHVEARWNGRGRPPSYPPNSPHYMGGTN